MDFIEQLLKLSGYTAILVVVDRLTKQAIFIPTHDTITSADLAKLFILHVFSKHSVPSHVTSDHGSEFISHFFRYLRKALDMWLHFTSGYHLEGDGQTKWTNQTLEQYLRVYSNYQQDNWSDLLPLTEFAYNNAPSMTTRISPFYANKGYHLNISVHLERELASGKAHEFTIDLDELHTALKEQIRTAQSHYQASADACHAPAPSFPTGSHAFMKAQFFRTTRLSKKLMEKYLGPFKVIAQVGTHSIILWLPNSMWAVHPIFHVSMLEPKHGNIIPERSQSPPPLVEIDSEPEYKISEILDSKIDKCRKHCNIVYLVQWTGYEGTYKETSWILANELGHAPEIITDFHKAYQDKPGPWN